MAIMVFSLLPMMAVREAAAADPELKVSGGSYYYDGHEKTVSAEVKNDTGWTIQYSFYSVYEKATWTEEAPKLIEPGTFVVYVRAIKGTQMLPEKQVTLEVVGNAPEGSSIKIIASGSITKAPVHKSASTSSQKVGELNAGETCTLVSQDGNWFEVTNGTITGFVYYEFISVTSRPDGGSGGGTVQTPDKVTITAYGGTYIYDGTEHKVKASLINGYGYVLEFSVDNGKTWVDKAPGLTEPGTLTVKIQATSSKGIATHADVVLKVLKELPAGTSVKLKKHGSTTSIPVRKTPSTSGKKVGTLTPGTVVSFLGQEGDWIKISYGEMEGYVYNWFVDLEDLELKPVITSQPESIWVMKDADAIFKVIVKGEGTITYQWQSWDGSSYKDVAGATSHSYSFKAAAADNGKKVRCVVTDSNGKVTSDVATLTVVTGKPDIKKQPENAGGVVGKTVRFIIEAVGAQSYQWQYKKNSSETEWLPVESDTANTTALTVKVTNENNGFIFRCKTTNSYGDTPSDPATLSIVKKAPKITKQPKKQTVKEGASVTFTVTASGDALTYQWQFKKKGTKKWQDCTGTSAKTATLSITASYADNGTLYRCVVKNAKKKVTSKTAKLTVKGNPVLNSVDVNPGSTVTAGTTVKIKVDVTANGAVKYQWYRKAPGAKAKWKKVKCTKAEYSFTALAKYDGYQYYCKITNRGTTIKSSPVSLNVY